MCDAGDFLFALFITEEGTELAQKAAKWLEGFVSSLCTRPTVAQV